MITILSLSDKKSLLQVELEGELNNCEANLNDDLSVKTIGLIGDVQIEPEDLELPVLVKIQEALISFEQEQSKKQLKSVESGCCYKMSQSKLLKSPISESSNEENFNEWSEVSDLSTIEDSLLEQINEYFNANFQK